MMWGLSGPCVLNLEFVWNAIKDERKKASCTVPTDIHNTGVQLQLIFIDSRRFFWWCHVSIYLDDLVCCRLLGQLSDSTDKLLVGCIVGFSSINHANA